eukprot:759710-Alexandrium_andersonii.AAC.1
MPRCQWMLCPSARTYALPRLWRNGASAPCYDHRSFWPPGVPRPAMWANARPAQGAWARCAYVWQRRQCVGRARRPAL